MSLIEFSLRITAALSAGMLIGIERQYHHKHTGFRMHGLMALGSAMFVLLSTSITDTHNGDITRIIGQVVTGAGFLCAGVVLHQGTSVQGITTAATLWCSCAAGCLAAAGMFYETAIGTAAVIVVNSVFRNLDKWLDKKAKGQNNNDRDGA